MGSGTSRGKKVAPANVREITVLNRDDNIVHSLNEDKLPLQPVKIPTFSNFTLSQNMAKHDCHSEGHHSEFSADEDDIAEELDRVLSEYERPRGIFSKGTNLPKKSFIRSKTYGFCRQVNHEREFNSSPQLPTPEQFEKESLLSIRAERVDKKNSLHQTAPCPDSALRSALLTVVCVESGTVADTASIPEGCHNPSVTMPVLLYDGTEEELMDTIEREYS